MCFAPFFYPALCSVAICFPCLLSEHCPLCVMFLHRNIFCLLLFFVVVVLFLNLSHFYYTLQGFACLFSFLFGQPVLTVLDIKNTLSSQRNIFRALKFLNDVDNFLFCTQTSPIPWGVWKHRTAFFLLVVVATSCKLVILMQSNPCMTIRQSLDRSVCKGYTK